MSKYHEVADGRYEYVGGPWKFVKEYTFKAGGSA